MRRIVAVWAVAVSVLGLAFAPPAAAAVAWNTAPVVTHDVANAELDAVDCPTAGFCVAVGSGELPGGVQQAVTEVSDGGAWQRKGIPVGDAADAALHGVDCVSATFCVGVGEYRPYDSSSDAQALAVVWNGTAWRPSSMGGAGDVPTRLHSVSCVSTTFCMAVGEREVDAGGQTPTAVNTLIEYYDGSSWRELGSVSPDRFSRLRSVSCPTTTFCVAVGTTGSDESDVDHTVALREVLGPQGWTLSSAGAPTATHPALTSPAGRTAGLYAVSCTSATFCLDVGFNDTFTGGAFAQVDRWDGTSWAGVPNSWTRSTTALTAVSCVSPTSCVLAARKGLSAVTGTWNGTLANEHRHGRGRHRRSLVPHCLGLRRCGRGRPEGRRDLQRHPLERRRDPEHPGRPGQRTRRGLVRLAHLVPRGGFAVRRPRRDAQHRRALGRLALVAGHE